MSTAKSDTDDHCGISNGKVANKDAERTLDRPLPSCNDTGRITGVTFIDHQARCVVNGSRLGKAFSANALNEWYDNGQNRRQKPDMAEISGSSKRKVKQYMLQ